MNTTAPFIASGRLSSLGLLRFSGADAASFLQGQLSNDIAQLSAGERSQLAAYSTPQGRVLGVLTLLPHSSGILAVLPAALRESIAARLTKFVLRAKVRIEIPGTEIAIAGHHGDADLLTAGLAVPGATNDYRETHGIGVARRGPSARFYVVGAVTDLQARGLLGDENDSQLVDNAWRLADIRDGLPQVYVENSEEFIAQMLNLDLIDGISFRKGCYTGQEIIARTQHLGRIKRRTFRLRLPAGAWTPGQSIRLSDGRNGRLLDIAESSDSAVEASAVLNLESGAEAGADVISISAIELPLPYSLTVAA